MNTDVLVENKINETKKIRNPSLSKRLGLHLSIHQTKKQLKNNDNNIIVSLKASILMTQFLEHYLQKLFHDILETASENNFKTISVDCIKKTLEKNQQHANLSYLLRTKTIYSGNKTFHPYLIPKPRQRKSLKSFQ